MSAAGSKTRIAIIGCGYVGSALGEALVRRGHEVVGTTTTPGRKEELRALGIEPQVIEVAEVKRLHAMLTDREAVFLTVAPPRRGECYREVYLGGVKNLLVAIDGTAVTRIVYTSSTRVYGQGDGGWVDESSPTAPQDENGRILVEAEDALLAAKGDHGEQVNCTGPQDAQTPRGPKSAGRRHEQEVFATVVRLGGIYGPGRDVVARIHSRAGTERSDGDAYVNLIHLDDIVSALSALVDVRHHGVLNLTDDQPEPRREFYDRVLSRADLRPIHWLPGDMPARKGKRVRNDLIKNTLGLVLKHPTH